jgi:hypothetical protein
MRDTTRGAVIVTGLAFMTVTAVLLAGPFGGNAPVPTGVSVSGNVIAYPPDGGTDVNIITSTAPGAYLAVAGDSAGTVLRTETTGPLAAPSIRPLTKPPSTRWPRPRARLAIRRW